MFLYLDPFGPTGCEFAMLEPFFSRNSAYSTEILLTMNVSGIHRLAARNVDKSIDERDDAEQIEENRRKLTRVFGGDYWQNILHQDLSAEMRIEQLINAYQTKIAEYLPFTCTCPVKENTHSAIKYYVISASRRVDSLLLFNDIMARVYNEEMHRADSKGTLWEYIDWQEMRSTNKLEPIIMEVVKSNPGISRKEAWISIVRRYRNYTDSDYRTMVKRLVSEKKLMFTASNDVKPISEVARLNDASKLYIHQQPDYYNLSLW